MYDTPGNAGLTNIKQLQNDSKNNRVTKGLLA
jgi:hypothetical protein